MKTSRGESTTPTEETIPVERLFSTDFILTLCVLFLTGIMVNMTIVSSPLFVRKLGGSDLAAGMATGILSIAALLGRPVSGFLLARSGRLPVMAIGIGLLAGSTLFLGFIPSIMIALAMRFAAGLGLSIQGTAGGTVVFDLLPKSRLVQGIACYTLALSFSAAIGPALGLFLVRASGFTLHYLIAGLLGIIGLLLLPAIRYERRHIVSSIETATPNASGANAVEAKKGGFLSSFLEPTAIPAAIVLVFIAVPIGGIISFLPGFMQYRGLHNPEIFFFLYSISMIVSRLFIGFLSGRYTIRRLLLAAMACEATALVLIAVSRSMGTLIVAALLYGAGYGIAYTLLNTMVAKNCPAHRRGAANATFLAAMDIGVGLGAVALGAGAQAFGIAWVYYLSAVSVSLGIVALSRMRL